MMLGGALPGPYLVRRGAFSAEFRGGLHLLMHPAIGRDYTGKVPDFAYVAVHTLRLAVFATGIAVMVGLPLGCALGIGRFRGRGVLLAIGNALTRVPPVAVGVVVILLIGGQTEFGVSSEIMKAGPGVFVGPLNGIPLFYQQRDVFAQTLLALPIIIALSATAVQRIPDELLDQAKAFGAPWWRRGLLALREARVAVLAAIIVAMGVTITAVGALYVLRGGGSDSLAMAALNNWQHPTLGADGFADSGQIAFSYAQILMGMFLVMAAGLTFLQQNRSSWVAGGQL